MNLPSDNDDRQPVSFESPLSVAPQLRLPAQPKPRSKRQWYLVAATITLITLAARLVLQDWIGDRPLLVLFLSPIVISAYAGGLGPGLLATCIGGLGTLYFILNPTAASVADKPLDLALWLVMLATGVLVSVLSEGLLRARRRAEASERLHAITLASIGDAVITTNIRGQITYLNIEAERLTGWTLPEALGQPLLAVFRVPKEQASLPVEHLVETVLQAENTVSLTEHLCLIARDGRTISIEASGAPIKLADGAPLGVVLVIRDNTERNRAEEERRENEERLRLALSAATMGIWEWNLQDDSVYWSPECYKLIGLDDFHSSLTAFRALVHPEDLPNLMAATNRAIETKAIFTAEFRVNLPDGRVRWFANLGRASYSAQDKPLRVIGISQDITERKHAEEALRESELRFRTLAETASDTIITIDSQGKIIFVNPAIEGVFGYPANELLGQDLTLLMPDYLRELHRIGLARYQQTGVRHTPWAGLELPGLHRDGHEIPLEFSFGEFTRAGQRYFTGIVRDITARKRAEEELRESERHFRALFEGAGVGNVECDALTGQFLQVNQKMCALTGYSAEELLLRNFSDITFPADRLVTLPDYQRFIAQEVSTYAVEKRYVRKDGTLAWVSVTSSLLLDDAGLPWRTVAAIQDITERKRFEAALQLSEERLRRLHQIISNPQLTHAEKINQLLALGCQQFGLENGVLGRLDQTTYRVTYAVSQTEAIKPGWTCPSQHTYCQETVRRAELLALEHTGATPWREHQAYASYGVETYFGVPVRCGDEVYGTLYFTSFAPRALPFTSGDQEFLRLMAQWIGAELTRQATAESLHESEARFRALFEQTAVGSIIVDLETQRIVDCNQVAAEMLGYSRKEFLTLSVTDIDTLHSPSKIADNKAVLDRQDKVQFETVYRSKTGTLKDVLVVATSIQIHGKKFGYGSIVDITEKKQAEAALQKERERLANIAAASPIAILSFRATAAGKHSYPYVSPAFYELYGVSAQDLIDNPGITDERVHPEDLPALVSSLFVSARTLSPWHHTWRVNHPDKGEIWVEGYSTPTRAEDGSIIWHGMIYEVTERIQAETALRTEKARLEKMAMASPLPMYSFHQAVDGKISFPYASAAFADMFGVPPAELIEDGSAIFAHLHPEDLQQIQTALIASAKAWSVLHEVYRYQHPHKGERWLESYAAPILEADGSLTWHGIANDITERKQSEQDLLLLQNQLRHLATHLQSVREEERATIAREIHDDLGQMLTAMRFNLKWIEQALEPGAETLRERVTNAMELLGQTIQIVRRISTSLHPSILDDFGLSAALEWQITEFQKHSGIRCQIEALPQSLTLERNRALALFRICQETLTNVARHAAATEISLSLQAEQENVWLRIHDNGRGITVDALAKRRSLGLISMRERALSLGGEFSVQGLPGQGTTVTVRIPIPEAVQPSLS
jgi:PAS domain S-box-containing protein